jgi:hypothetical protein
MKRIFFILAVTFSLTSLSSFASDIKVSPAALEAFKYSFKHASEVNWTAGENFYKADFVQDGQYLTAFFDGDGAFLAVTKNITSTQLPVKLQTGLKKQQEGFWITNLIEVAKEYGTSYYVTLENADTRIILKASGNSWEVYQKVTKS